MMKDRKPVLVWHRSRIQSESAVRATKFSIITHVLTYSRQTFYHCRHVLFPEEDWFNSRSLNSTKGWVSGLNKIRRIRIQFFFVEEDDATLHDLRIDLWTNGFDVKIVSVKTRGAYVLFPRLLLAEVVFSLTLLGRLSGRCSVIAAFIWLKQKWRCDMSCLLDTLHMILSERDTSTNCSRNARFALRN